MFILQHSLVIQLLDLPVSDVGCHVVVSFERTVKVLVLGLELLLILFEPLHQVLQFDIIILLVLLQLKLIIEVARAKLINQYHQLNYFA